jgi:CheY-like chemotaxis protein
MHRRGQTKLSRDRIGDRRSEHDSGSPVSAVRHGKSPRRVLVAEDDDGAALLLQALLEGDTRVEMVGRARNGREALALAASLNPDVILMDLQMPVMGGVEAIRRLRERGSTVRIIVVTGAEEASIPAALKAGANAYVTKPPVPEQLMAAILAEAPET